MSKKRKCEICGTVFLPKSANAKYCGAICREKARKANRKQWEADTNYNERQRLLMRERDKRKAEESRQARRQITEEERQAREAEARTRSEAHKKDLQARADNGETFAQLIIEQKKHGKTTPEYWELFKKYELEQAEALGKPSTLQINGIPITHNNFALAVAISIDETHTILLTR